MAHVVAIVAGTNTPSNADRMTESFIKGLEDEGVEVHKLILKDLAIRHFTLEYYRPECSVEDDFCRVEELILSSHGVVLASPIWNFSVPAHLKNLIDRMGGFALDEKTHAKGQLKGKPFFFIFTGGAPMIAWKAIMHITTAHIPESIKYYGGSVIGRHYEPRCMPAEGKFGLVVDKRVRTLRSLTKKGRFFAQIVKVYAETQKLPWRYRCTLCVRTLAQAIVNRATYRLSPYQ
jgi:multimeric flavodoxin WrbA